MSQYISRVLRSMWLLWVRCLALGSSIAWSAAAVPCVALCDVTCEGVLIKYILYRSCVDLNEHYIIEDLENKCHFSYAFQELAEIHLVISANKKHKGQAGFPPPPKAMLLF
jgi:hypothetical protein